jgi:raffinose/stachyose/melibiose transport system substrate-binding protein
VLEAAGYMPFANGSKDAWTAAEIVYMNLVPNFIGGREGRLAYLNGERCFNDTDIVAAFQGVADLEPYFPDGHELLGYIDSLELFLQRRAAMWMSGSWDIPYFEEAEPDFAWSVFAVPPPEGRPAYVTFHLDVAIGLNAASRHPAAARAFLTWMTTPVFGELLGNEMPGFFPMHRAALELDNGHANDFLALNQDRGTDIRFAWEMLRDGTPSGYDLMQEGALAILRGEQTPQEAADHLQAGLAEWFIPAQTCGP